MKKQKRYKICRGLFFWYFFWQLVPGWLLGNGSRKRVSRNADRGSRSILWRGCFYSASGNRVCREKVSLKEAFHWCPEYLQGLRVKEVELSPGLYLTEEDPGDFTGERANGQFRVCLEINDSGKELLTEDGCPGNWWIQEEETVDLNMILEFSKALTDNESERYIDVTLGNDQVTLKRRIWLVCKVIPVSFPALEYSQAPVTS